MNISTPLSTKHLHDVLILAPATIKTPLPPPPSLIIVIHWLDCSMINSWARAVCACVMPRYGRHLAHLSVCLSLSLAPPHCQTLATHTHIHHAHPIRLHTPSPQSSSVPHTNTQCTYTTTSLLYTLTLNLTSKPALPAPQPTWKEIATWPC